MPVEGQNYSVNAPTLGSAIARFSPVPGARQALDFADRARGGAPRTVLEGEQFDNLDRGIQADRAELARRRTDNAPPSRTNRPEGSVLNLPERAAKTPRGRVDRSAEQEARRAERVEQQIFAARQRLLGTVDQEAQTVQQRYDLEKEQTGMERQARDAKLASDTRQGEITDEEAAQIRLLNQQTDAQEDIVANANLARDLSDERLANERLISDLTADLLSLQSGAARTAKERQRIELELLAEVQRDRRRALNAELNDPKYSPEDRTRITDLADQRDRMEEDAVRRANLGPIDQWREASLRSAAEINEAFENVAANGLDALNEGLVDALMGTKSLGEVFSQVAKQILADLLSISVRRGITEPLANALFGGGQTGGKGGGGGGFLSSIGSAIFGGLRGGAGGGGGGFSLPNILGSVLGKITGTSAPATANSLNVKIGVNDDRFNAYVDGRAAPMASQAASAAVSGSRTIVPADMAQTSRYTRR